MDYQKVKILLDKIKSSKPRILVIGDIMLDKYIKGSVNRISPEAPVPILEFEKETNVLGGAGNVAHNLVNLGAEVELATIIGDDSSGENIRELLKKNQISSKYIHSSSNIITTTKTRFISQPTHLLRLDHDSKGFDNSDLAILNNKLNNIYKKLDCIILSDYNKGVCFSSFIKEIIKKSNSLKIPTFIDPKGLEWSKYSGATFITPNINEAEKEIKVKLKKTFEFEKAAKAIINKYNLLSCVITRGRKGMTCVFNGKIINQKVQKKEVFDVSGAGDTVISCLAASYSSGMNIDDSLFLAGILSSQVVEYIGTVPFSVKMLSENDT